MDKNLHSRPNLQHLRGQAKELLNSLRDRNPIAAQTFKLHLPSAQSMAENEIFAAGFRLADAQSAIARKSGFASWPRLAHHVEQLRSLEGDWSFEYLQVEGNEIASAMYAGSRILIDGDKFRTESPMANYDGEFSIDVEKDPHEIDIEFVEGPEAGNWSYGIYRLEGDKLTICLGLTGARRPAEFATAPKSGHALEILRRVSNDRPGGVTGGQRSEVQPTPPWTDPEVDLGEIEIRPDHLRLEGEWKALKIVADGQSLPAALLKDGRRVGNGTHVTVTLMGQVMVDADFRIRDGSEPIEVDYLTTRPDGTRFVQLGIMRWEGDDITSCFAPPSIPRPTAFESVKGSGIVLSSWRRIKAS
jgi:uncharacterized protein (TIGR03067 family)